MKFLLNALSAVGGAQQMLVNLAVSVIIFVLVAGGFFFWGVRYEKAKWDAANAKVEQIDNKHQAASKENTTTVEIRYVDRVIIVS